MILHVFFQIGVNGVISKVVVLQPYLHNENSNVTEFVLQIRTNGQYLPSYRSTVKLTGCPSGWGLNGNENFACGKVRLVVDRFDF